MLLPYKCPTTSVQLLHFGVKCSNFAIVKQNNKNNSLDRKIFFPGQEKNDECGMFNVEWSAEPMKNVECGMLNVEWSAEPMKNEE